MLVCLNTLRLDLEVVQRTLWLKAKVDVGSCLESCSHTLSLESLLRTLGAYRGFEDKIDDNGSEKNIEVSSPSGNRSRALSSTFGSDLVAGSACSRDNE